MNDVWNRIGKLAAQGGKKAAIQAGKWGEQASAQAKLWQIRHEFREIYAKIGECCWEKYRQEAEPLFPQAFSRLRVLEAEQKTLQERIHRGKDREGE